MKVTLSELLSIDSALRKVLNAPLPIKTAFKFKKLVKALREDIAVMEETRKDLIKKHSDESDGKFTVREEEKEAFEAAHKELLEAEIEVDFSPVPVEDLAGVQLTATEAFDLEKFIKI